MLKGMVKRECVRWLTAWFVFQSIQQTPYYYIPTYKIPCDEEGGSRLSQSGWEVEGEGAEQGSLAGGGSSAQMKYVALEVSLLWLFIGTK